MICYCISWYLVEYPYPSLQMSASYASRVGIRKYNVHLAIKKLFILLVWIYCVFIVKKLI